MYSLARFKIFLVPLIESHANQIRKLNQRRKPNEGGNFSNCSRFLREGTEVPHISDRNEIRKIMIYCIAECVHTKKSSRTQTKESKNETFFLLLLLRCCFVGLCFVLFFWVLRFLLINSLLKQGGTGILKLL